MYSSIKINFSGFSFLNEKELEAVVIYSSLKRVATGGFRMIP